jgi:hypothetical protein
MLSARERGQEVELVLAASFKARPDPFNSLALGVRLALMLATLLRPQQRL